MRRFTTLFLRHDASKSLFTRKTHTELPIDVFKRVFASFCFITYYEAVFSFTESSVISYIEKAISIEKVNVDKFGYLMDLVESVCILQRDGLNYVFVHRTFQEYFAAQFISANRQIDIFKALDRIGMRGASEKCITILNDISPDIVMPWAIRVLRSMGRKVRGTDPLRRTSAYIAATDRKPIIVKEFTLLLRRGKEQQMPFACLPLLKLIYGFTNADYEAELSLVYNDSDVLRAWYDSVYGKTKAGKARRIHQDQMATLVSGDPARDDPWLDAMGVSLFCLRESDWISTTAETLEERSKERADDLNDILKI